MMLKSTPSHSGTKHLAEIYDGGTRTQAARICGVGLQVIRGWVLRFNSGGPNGLIDRKAPGKAPSLDQEQRRTLVEIVESGPLPASMASSGGGWSI